MASATVLSPIEAAAPHGYAAAAPLPDVLPPVKTRKGFIGGSTSGRGAAAG